MNQKARNLQNFTDRCLGNCPAALWTEKLANSRILRHKNFKLKWEGGKTMAMNGRNTYVEVDASAVVRTIIDNEINYLVAGGAKPKKVRLLQVGVPGFPASFLRQTLGKRITLQYGDKSSPDFVMPNSGYVRRLVREERDNIITSHIRTASGLVNRQTGLPCDVADYEAHVNACNRVLEML